jgi:SAM-dependent methyltransferase
MSRSPFDALASEYDAARPSYPDGLYDALDELAGPLDGALVAEVGAGTGISTRGLLSRGADVVAYDLAPNMLERLRANGSPGPGALLGTAVADAHALPLRDGVADVVTYAQAFHWVRGPDAATEAARVLRLDGALAVWWNDSAAQGEPWWRRQQELLEQVVTAYRRDYRVHDVAVDLRAAFAGVETAEVPWVRRLDVETYVTFLASKSYVASLGGRLQTFLDEQRAVLAEAFPDGTVEEPYVTRLWVAR